MSAKAIMCQGTGSHVGKSVVVAALCRLYARAGYRVAPFKAQNMSNNSFVTADGGEMGRAQVFQAQAAGVEPVVEMNPILLKPDADTRAQVVRLGQPVSAMEVKEYQDYQAVAWPAVTQAYDRLRRDYDLIVLEGAGSPAEINLRGRDIVNMKMALHAGSPVILIGDIERGGVFASLYGTIELLEPDERRLVKAFLINKFRGDASLLESGIECLEDKTGIPVLGVLPYAFGLPVDLRGHVAGRLVGLRGQDAGSRHQACRSAGAGLELRLARVGGGLWVRPLPEKEISNETSVRLRACWPGPRVALLQYIARRSGRRIARTGC